MIRRSLSVLFLSAALAAAPAMPFGAFADSDSDPGRGKDRDHEDDDHDAAWAAVKRGEALPLAEVIATVAGQLPGEILEIEFDREDGRWLYEFKVIDGTGRLHEIYVDAATARILPDRDD